MDIKWSFQQQCGCISWNVRSLYGPSLTSFGAFSVLQIKKLKKRSLANQHSKLIVITPVPKGNNILLQVRGLQSLVVTKVTWTTSILSKYCTMGKGNPALGRPFSWLKPLEFNIKSLLSSDSTLLYLCSSTICLCLLFCIYFIRKEEKEQIRYLILKVNVTFMRYNAVSSSGLCFFFSRSLGCYLCH